MSSKTALHAGIGQDGSYLTGLLLENGYDVYGIYQVRTTRRGPCSPTRAT